MLLMGLKHNMIDINAAMGIVQLRKIEKSWLKRRKINYIKKLFKLPIKTQIFAKKISNTLITYFF